MEVLPKRFAKYGLTIHPEKTRMVYFGNLRASQRTPKQRVDIQFPRVHALLGQVSERKLGHQAEHRKAALQGHSRKYRIGADGIDICRSANNSPAHAETEGALCLLRNHRQLSMSANFRPRGDSGLAEMAQQEITEWTYSVGEL